MEREPNLSPDLRRLPGGRQRKAGAKWDSLPPGAADFFLPPTLLGPRPTRRPDQGDAGPHRPGAAASYGPSPRGIGWRYAAPADVPRQLQEVLVEPWLRDALIRLNPEIAAQPGRADEVLCKLRAIVLSVRSDGLIRANEEMTAWMRGERSTPFGLNDQHVPVRLIAMDGANDLKRNQFVVTQQFTYCAGATQRCAELVLLVNGLPLVLIEAKGPFKKSISWAVAAVQVQGDYEKFVPELFVCNVFSVATEGKACHYGSIGLPVKDWGPWHLDGVDGEHSAQHHPLKSLMLSAESMLRPTVVLDIPGSFTLGPVRHGQEEAPHQDHLPLPAVRGGQQAGGAGAGGPPPQGLDLAFPGLGQVAADGVCRAEAAHARRPVGPGQGQPGQDRRQDGRAGEDTRAPAQGVRRHRASGRKPRTRGGPSCRPLAPTSRCRWPRSAAACMPRNGCWTASATRPTR